MTETSPSDDAWDPAVYDRYRAQRERPLADLLELVDPVPGGRAADLGCGSGRSTVELHERVGASTTVGIDSSAAMLARAGAPPPGVRYELGDLLQLDGRWDVLFANASLQWIPEQRRALTRLTETLAPRGQLAFQVPANYDHPSHTIADALGERFGLEPLARTAAVLSPAGYAEVLHALGLRELRVELRVYGHEMARTDEVVAWVQGTLLTSYRRRLGTRYEAFEDAYRTALLEELGDPAGDAPYFYAFPRILARGRATT